MYKKLIAFALTPTLFVFAQNGPPPIPGQSAPTAPQFQGQPGPAAGYPAPTAAPQFQGQPRPAAGYPAPTAAPRFQGQPGPAAHPVGAPQFHSQPGPAAHPAGAPQFHGQPGPAAHPAGAHQFHGQPGPAAHPAGAPQFHGQPGPAAHPTGAPQFHGQPGPAHPNTHNGPGAHNPGEPDHDEIVGSVIGIDVEKQLVRIMTKQGPVSLKVTDDSELLIPGERPEALMDIDPEDFKRESKGRMVRIASRDGKIDHIEPAE